MRLSRASAYALGAVLQLADAPQGVPIPCSRLAKLGQMPERFLLQLLRSLVNHNILRSTRGVEGGYTLARPLSEITLLQLFEATDGPLIPTIPPLDSIPPDARGTLQALMEDLSAAENQRLSEIKLSDLRSARRMDEQEFSEEQENVDGDDGNGSEGAA